MTTRCNALGLAALVTIASGCASMGVRRDVHEADWLLVETAHIELRTDLDRVEAVRRAQELEQTWQALALMYAAVAPGRPPPPGRLAVIHYDRCRDLMQRQGKRSVDGFVFQAPAWMSQPIAVTCDWSRDQVLIHELAHVFNAHHVPGMPVWLDEGLASYYQSLTFRSGKAIIGDIPRWLPGGCAGTRPPSIEKLRGMGYEEFHAEPDESCHYLLAWKLVHLLNGTSPDLLRRFHRYLAGLRGASTREQAWTDAFGDLPDGSLSKAYDRYGYRTTRLHGWSAPFDPPEPPRPRMRALRPAEAHVLWLNMLLYLGEPAQARLQLDGMAEVDPGSPDLLYWRAVLLRSAASIPVLREYLSRRPEDERAWRLLVELELGAAVPSGYLDPGRVPPAALTALENDVRQLMRRARQPSSLKTIAWYHALRQEPVAGLRFAAQSVHQEPGCGSCWDTMALLLFQAGRVESALQAQERAVNLSAERADLDMLARLRYYRAKVASGATRRPRN